MGQRRPASVAWQKNCDTSRRKHPASDRDCTQAHDQFTSDGEEALYLGIVQDWFDWSFRQVFDFKIRESLLKSFAEEGRTVCIWLRDQKALSLGSFVLQKGQDQVHVRGDFRHLTSSLPWRNSWQAYCEASPCWPHIQSHNFRLPPHKSIALWWTVQCAPIQKPGTLIAAHKFA